MDLQKHIASEPEELQLEASHAVEAFGSGVRTTLRNNATAYGYSVAVTSAFGLVSALQRRDSFPLQALFFAGGAALAFLVVGAVASRFFKRTTSPEPGDVVMLSGAMDIVAIMAAVGVAIPVAALPGLVAWPCTAFVMTSTYLLVSALDVLVARRLARSRWGERGADEAAQPEG